MALVVKDRVRETTTTTGTGTITLAGALAGFQSFSAIGDGNTTYYTISLPGANEWEVGIGTYTSSGTTLSRDTILASSNSGSAVNFSAGTKDVFCTYPAGRSVYYDTATNVTLNALTLSGGTANGVVYLNGSKVATSGSALTFDGTTFQYTGAANFATSTGNVGIGTSSPAYKLDASITTTAPASRISNTNASTSGAFNDNLALIVSNANNTNGNRSGIAFFDSSAVVAEIYAINQNHTTHVADLAFAVRNAGIYTEKARLTSAGTLNIVGAGTAGSTQAISFNGAAPVNSLVVEGTTGNVGIGTNSPAATAGVTLSKTSNVAFEALLPAVASIAFGYNNSGSTNAWGAATGAGFFGTPQAVSLTFTTSAIERARINTSGVLILGSGEASATVAGNTFRAPNAAGTDIAGANLVIAAGNGTGTGGSGYLAFQTAAAGSTGTTANTMQTRLYIDKDGNTGIGTSSPAALFHISSGAGTKAIWGTTRSIGGANRNWQIAVDEYVEGEFTITPSTALGGTTFTTPALRISNAGNVGIGTASPTFKLEVSGGDASIYGVRVGLGAGSIAQNTVVGSGALAANTTGAYSVAFGYQALNKITVGSYATAVGAQALFNNTGSNNTALGYQAGYTNVSGTNGTYLGYQAGFTTTGSGFVAIGYKSGYVKSGSDSYSSVMVGNEAGVATTTGLDNTFVGGFAARINTFGSNNTALGAAALYSNTTGSYNTAIGYQSGYSNTFGTLTAVGSLVLYGNTTGVANTAIGGYVSGVSYAAMQSNTFGSYNSAVGSGALYSNTTGGNNTAVGYQSAYSNTTGTNNTAVGYQAAYSNTTGANNTAVGYQAAYSNTTAYNNTAIGRQALYSNTTAYNNTAVGYQAGYTNSTGLEINAFGGASLYSNTTGSYNNAFGANALYSNTTGVQNTAIGHNAGYASTIASFVTAVGSNSARFNTADALTAIGYSAAYNNTTGANNTAIGRQALYSNTTAYNNTAVGYQAGYNTTAEQNVFVGTVSGYANSTGKNHVFIGYYAGNANTTGSNNVFIGSAAGKLVTTGSSNTFIGSGVLNVSDGSGSAMTTGSKNTIIGNYTGNQSSLDIRTASNYIVLSDGDGNPRGVFDSSGNFGIGTGAPAKKLDVAGTIRANVDTGTASAIDLTYSSSTRTIHALETGGSNARPLRILAQSLTYADDSATRLTIDTSGNLGVGVAPSAWSGYKALEIAVGRGFVASSDSAYRFYAGTNAYWNGSAWKYIASTYASLYDQGDSTHRWYTAASGTAGNTISFNQSMTLDSSGNLAVGQTDTSSGKFTVNAGASGGCAAFITTDTVCDIRLVDSGTTNGRVRIRSKSDALQFMTTTTERMTILSTGEVGIATVTPTAFLDVNSDVFRLRSSKTPASAGAAGNAGDICWDSNYVYICVATNTWKRVAIATW